MERQGAPNPIPDVTLGMIGSRDDGTLAGLAEYHLLKMQLMSIRNLPETTSPHPRVTLD